VGYVSRFGSSKDPLSPILFEDPATNQLTGFNYDLAQAMGAKLDIKFTFKELPFFTHSFFALTEKDIDLSMSVLRDHADAREKERVIDFIDYLEPGTVLLVRKGTKDRFRSADDLCGKTIARPLETPPGSILDDSDRCREQGRGEIKLMTCPTLERTQEPEDVHVALRNCPQHADPLQLLAVGQADAAILDTPLWARARKRTPVFEQQLETAFAKVDAGPYGIAVRASDRQLRDAVRSALRAVIADETYDRLIARWRLGGQALKTAEINGGP
jgi:polar amino acid transport system substrate-binding protein